MSYSDGCGSDDSVGASSSEILETIQGLNVSIDILDKDIKASSASDDFKKLWDVYYKEWGSFYEKNQKPYNTWEGGKAWASRVFTGDEEREISLFKMKYNKFLIAAQAAGVKTLAQPETKAGLPVGFFGNLTLGKLLFGGGIVAAIFYGVRSEIPVKRHTEIKIPKSIKLYPASAEFAPEKPSAIKGLSMKAGGWYSANKARLTSHHGKKDKG